MEGLARFAALPRRNAGAGAIAAAEVQGYVYDAKQRLAELARNVWGDEGLADRLEREAAELRLRFDDASGASVRAAGRMRSPSTARNGR